MFPFNLLWPPIEWGTPVWGSVSAVVPTSPPFFEGCDKHHQIILGSTSYWLWVGCWVSPGKVFITRSSPCSFHLRVWKWSPSWMAASAGPPIPFTHKGEQSFKHRPDLGTPPLKTSQWLQQGQRPKSSLWATSCDWPVWLALPQFPHMWRTLWPLGLSQCCSLS